MGVIETQSADLQDTTEALIENLQRGNPRVQRQSKGYVRESIGGRSGLTTTLRNVSEVTGGPEIVTVSTVLLRDGSALYVIAVAPLDEMNRYQQTFRRMKQSLQINDQQLAQR